jgi:predicted secreted protein
MPGATQIDVHRDSLVRYIGEENKRVVTAYLDEKQNRWKEDAEVHLTSRGYLRKDANDIDEDNLGTLPEFDLVQSRL